jgi:hypothetical protein
MDKRSEFTFVAHRWQKNLFVLILKHKCEIWDSHSSSNDDYCLLRWHVVYFTRHVELFQRNCLRLHTLKMEAACSSKTTRIYQITQHHISEESNLQNRGAPKDSEWHCMEGVQNNFIFQLSVLALDARSSPNCYTEIRSIEWQVI